MLRLLRQTLIVLVAVVTSQVAAARPNAVYEDRSHNEVGTFDQHLSKLCAKRLFNQRSQFRHSAYFGVGRVLLGAAMGNGWNLEDPTGARRFGMDYWFRNDGFSNCEVYQAVNPGRSPAAKARNGATRR